MTTKFEPNECVIFVQSKKIGTHKNKTINRSEKCENYPTTKISTFTVF